MRDTSRRRWQQWRVAVVERPAAPGTNRFVRTPLAAEQPGPDGIRHELVARVRREIEAGTYDTDEKWLAAEERLLQRVLGGT